MLGFGLLWNLMWRNEYNMRTGLIIHPVSGVRYDLLLCQFNLSVNLFLGCMPIGIVGTFVYGGLFAGLSFFGGLIAYWISCGKIAEL